MDVKSVVNDVVKKIKGNKNLLKDFKSDPIKTVKSLVGDVSEDNLKEIVEEVTKKVGADAAASAVTSKLKGLFGK